MKLSFASKDIEQAPATFTRLRVTEENKGTTRIVREKGIDWLEIGVGKFKDVNHRHFITLCRSIIQTAKKNKTEKLAIEFDREHVYFPHFPQLREYSPEHLGSLIAQNFEMANFEFVTFKTKPKEGWNFIDEVLVCGKTPKSMQDGMKKGQLIGQAINECRELANTPGGSLTPRGLGKTAKDAVKTFKNVTVKTLGRSDIEKLGMGALAAVGSGSSHEPTFTIMEYKGAAGKPIVLAGKGITFDSGGLNIKPSTGIYEMHMDMSGGASVIFAIKLAAQLKLKKHIIGLIAAAENMPGNNAVRPGDIVKSLSGKTIEVTDTDAEGRLVLSDALTYAKRFNPSVVIDIATLTGAAMIALGFNASGLMTRDDTLADQLLELGEISGDYLWRLPLWEEYESQMKSSFADIANHPTDGTARYGGASQGGIFLWEFAKELNCPWAHLDIAPKMTASKLDELAKGAAGAPVRLLLSFIESWNVK